jgi:predicted MFS family arabinose efflux permease
VSGDRSDATSDAPTSTSGPTGLVPLTTVRLAANGLFRFAYPFLGLVAADVGLGDRAAGLLLTGLAVGGMSTPVARRVVAGRGESPRRLAVAGLLLLFAGTMAVGGLAPTLAAATPALAATVAVVGMAVLGLAKPLLDVGSIGYVSDRVPYARRARATSVMELTWAGGLLLLAPVGALASATSWRVGLIGLGLVCLAGAVLVRFRLDPDPARTGRSSPPTPDVAGSAAPRGVGWRFLLVGALLFTALEATFGVVGLWLEDVRGVSPALLGTFTAVAALGELAGSTFVLAFADRLGKARVLVLGLLVCVVGFGALPFAPNLPLALVALAVGLFGTESAIVAAIPLGSEVAPGARTAFLSRMWGTASVARAVVGALGPVLLLSIGIGANSTLSVVAALAAVVLTLDLLRRAPQLSR